MTQKHWHPELELETRDLLDRLVDGSFTHRQRERLEQLVIEFPAAKAIYINGMQLEAMLCQTADEQLAPESTVKSHGIFPAVGQILSGIFGDSGFSKLLVLAAVLGIGIACFWVFGNPSTSEKIIAQLASTPATVWESEEPDSSGVAGGLYEISQGEIELEFPSGAAVTVSGPAEFSLEAPETMKVFRGLVETDVPESAIGFTVHVPNVAYVDMGTRAKIEVLSDGTSTVQVDEGMVKVSVRRPDGHEVVSETIPAGHSRAVDLSGVIQTTQKFVHQQQPGEQHLIIQAEATSVSPGLNQFFAPVHAEGASGAKGFNALRATMEGVTGLPQETNFSVQKEEAISYQVRFSEPGRYYWHLRCQAPDKNSNSIYVSQGDSASHFLLDQQVDGPVRIPPSNKGWQWVTFGFIDVTDTKMHTWAMAPREDGLIIDAIVFSRSPRGDGSIYDQFDKSILK